MAAEFTLLGRKFRVWELAAVGAVAYLLWPKKAAANVMPTTTLVGVTDRKEWARRLFDAIGRVLPHLSPSARAMIVGHAALETGYPPYRQDSAANCNNIFNITTGSGWDKAGKAYCEGGDVTYSNPLPDGSPRPITQRWRSYPSLEDAVSDYWQMLGRKATYKAARDALEQNDYVTFATKLREGGYYDAPLAGYVSGIRGTTSYAKKLLDLA
jgi:hypothetical protein